MEKGGGERECQTWCNQCHLNQTPDRTSLPNRPYGIAKGPIGCECFLAENSIRLGPGPRKPGSVWEQPVFLRARDLYKVLTTEVPCLSGNILEEVIPKLCWSQTVKGFHDRPAHFAPPNWTGPEWNMEVSHVFMLPAWDFKIGMAFKYLSAHTIWLPGWAGLGSHYIPSP